MTPTPYIDFGVVICTPPPVVSTQGKLLTLLLEGDAKKLDALVERVLNAPAGTAAEYRAIGSTVILQLGGIEAIRSGPPYDQAGSARETQASLWVPVVAGKQVGPVFYATRLGIFCPYLFVDNPMSLVGGREVFGYPKSGGRFTPAAGDGDDITVRVFGGDFGPTATAQWHRLLRVRRETLNAGAPGPLLDGAVAVADALAGQLKIPAWENVVFDPLAATELLAGGDTSQVFLKQFRDAKGPGACYQEVIEAPVHMDDIKVQATGSAWTVEVSPLDSHPLGRELGLATQTTARAFHLDLDFTLAGGDVVV